MLSRELSDSPVDSSSDANGFCGCSSATESAVVLNVKSRCILKKFEVLRKLLRG